MKRLGAWVALTCAGFATCGGNHLQGLGPTVQFEASDIDPAAASVGFVFGAVAGSIIAALQWIVLRSWTLRARDWIALTALGFGLAHAFNDAVPYRPLDLPALLLVEGLVVGALQSIALRGVLARSWIWAPVTALAWLLGFTVGVSLLGQVYGNPLAEVLIGNGTAGLLIGLITGTLLWRVGARRTRTPSVLFAG